MANFRVVAATAVLVGCFALLATPANAQTGGCVKKELVGFGSKSKTIKKINKVQSSGECLEICNKNPGCNSAVYFQLRKLCFLKAGTEATRDNNKDPTKALLFCDKTPAGVKCPAGQIKKELLGFGSKSETVKLISNIPTIDACLGECLKNAQCKSAVSFKNKKCALKSGDLDVQDNNDDPLKTLVACVPESEPAPITTAAAAKSSSADALDDPCTTTFCECNLAQKRACLKNGGSPFNFEKKVFCIRKRFDFTCAEVNIDVKVVDGTPSLFLGFGEFDSNVDEDADYQVCDQNNFSTVEANTFCKGLGFRSGIANGKVTEPSPQSQKAFFSCNGDGDLAACTLIALPKSWICQQASFQCSTAGLDPATGFPIADCRNGFVPVPFSLEDGLRCVRAEV